MANGQLQITKILKSLSSLDIALWQAYDKLYPFGQHHTDFLIAQLIAIIFNANKASNIPAISVNDVLGIHEPLTEEKVEAVIRSLH